MNLDDEFNDFSKFPEPPLLTLVRRPVAAGYDQPDGWDEVYGREMWRRPSEIS